jgi:SP family arabinose:H+ symporter-like MFS transporter
MNRIEQADQPNPIHYVLLLSLVAAVGGLLFGYDTAVIAGGIGFLQERFDLSAAMKGWAASSALLGCIAGALVSGTLGDRYGRKRMLVVCAVLFAVSAIGSAIPRNLTEFSIARFIGGVGVGAASMLSPLYIAEIAPARMRGRLVSLNQLAIVCGIFGVYFVNLLIQRMGDHAWNVEQGWRWMFGSEMLPALLFIFLLLLVPESPRWLVREGRGEEALAIFSRISGRAEAQREVASIEGALAHETGSIRQLFGPGLRVALGIGLALALFQQFSGINAIMYYAPEIFKATGSSVDGAFLQAVSVGTVNLFFTFLAIWLVDRVGRKVLLLAGAAVECLALVGVGYYFHVGSAGWGVLLFVLLYVAAFAATMGPVVWVVISEIFPTKIRGRAMSISIVLLWIACFVVSQTFPMLVEWLGIARTFWAYALVCAGCFLFVLRVVPETKGRSLEEIERSWIRDRG